MRIGWTLPPAAAPIPWTTILRSLSACLLSDGSDKTFEQEVKKEFKSEYCFSLSSGKAALTLILIALQKKYPGRSQVLIPAFTCYSVPAAIKRAGLQIRLCDMGKESLDFDKKQLQGIIEDDKQKNNILCVLVTHLFGCPADFHAIDEIIKGQVPIIEDAAQAMGGEISGKKMGTLGEIGFFSLGRGKALSAMEGGVIITNQRGFGEEIAVLVGECEPYSTADKIKLTIKTILTTILQHPLMFWLPKSIPFLRLGETLYEEQFSVKIMSDVQKKLLFNWKERLANHQRIRKKAMSQWRQNMPPDLILICKNIMADSIIRLPVLAASLEEKNTIHRKSEKNGYGMMPTYPTPINEIPEISAEFGDKMYPNAKQLSTCLLTLPVHDFVTTAWVSKLTW